MRAVKSMPLDVLDRLVPGSGESPEQFAIRNENTPENRRWRRLTAMMDDMEPQIKGLLKQELSALKPFDKGDLAAYWTDRWGYSHAMVAEYLDEEEGTVRQQKKRSIGLHQCDKPGECRGTRKCAHRRGEELWDAVIPRFAAKLGFHGGDKV